MTTTVLDVRNLTITFDYENHTPVRNQSFTLMEGHPLPVVGSSGSGKSIILHALAGLLGGARVSFDQITIDFGPGLKLSCKGAGSEHAYRDYQRAVAPILEKHAFFIFQDAFNYLHPWRSIGEQLLECISDTWTLAEKIGQVYDACSNVGLLPLLAAERNRQEAALFQMRPKQLSGGMCQRVQLAMALLKKPKILFADEPMTDLDALGKSAVEELLRQHFLGVKTIAVMIATHDLPFLESLDIPSGSWLKLTDLEKQGSEIQFVSGEATPRNFFRIDTEKKHLAHIYEQGYRRAVYCNRDFSFLQGEHLGLIGESGSGKTTLAKVIANLEKPADGAIVFDGLEEKPAGFWSANSNRFYNHVQMAFQDVGATLNPHETLSKILGDIIKRKALQEVIEPEDLFQKVGLENEMDKRPYQLSMGMQRRFSLIKALLSLAINKDGTNSPGLLILDEITRGLDVKNRDRVIQLLLNPSLNVGRRLTLLVISHDWPFVQSLCSRVLVLYRGWVIEERSRNSEGDFEFLHPYSRALTREKKEPSFEREQGNVGCPYYSHCRLVRESRVPEVCMHPVWQSNENGASLCSYSSPEEE